MNFRDPKARSQAGFPMAPMIDIAFILLSFFIATQIYARWEREIDVRLPTAESGSSLDRLPGEIIVNVMPDGAFVVNRNAMDEVALRAFLQKLADLFKGQPIVIRADRRTAYEHVVKVLDLCRLTDIWNIRFAIDAAPDRAAAAAAPAVGAAPDNPRTALP
jgi:biopolymer transport protein ExbD